MTTVQVWQRPVLVRPVKEVVDATYSFVAGDEVRVVVGDSGSAQTFTVEPDSVTDFPDGVLLTVCQDGAGQVTVAAGSGVTIKSADGALKLRKQYSAVQLWKETTNTWWAFGDVVA